jgi:hypothetical protein
MIDLERTVFDVIAVEIDKLDHNELIAAIRQNALQAPKLGVIIPGSGCRFCLPRYDDLHREMESEFECDLRACMMHSLVYHTLGILQDANLTVNVAHVRLMGVLQTIFSEQKAKEIATCLMETLKATDKSPVNNGWAD